MAVARLHTTKCQSLVQESSLTASLTLHNPAPAADLVVVIFPELHELGTYMHFFVSSQRNRTRNEKLRLSPP